MAVRKRKRFSLNERIAHFDKVAKTEFEKTGGNLHAPMSNREKYAHGYLQGAQRGLSSNHNKLDKYTKLGESAGNRARLKSQNLKF